MLPDEMDLPVGRVPGGVAKRTGGGPRFGDVWRRSALDGIRQKVDDHNFAVTTVGPVLDPTIYLSYL